MAVNYGLYQLSNSQMVPKRPSFPIEEYVKVIDMKNQLWEKGKLGAMALRSDSDALQYLPQDKALANQLYGDAMGTISGWDKANNYEDLVFQVADKAREFKLNTAGMQGAYNQYLKSYDEIQKAAPTLKLRPSDIAEHMAAELKSYQGQRKDPVTGRYQGVYQNITAVERPDDMKIIDDAIRGITADEGGSENFATRVGADGEMEYTYGGEWKRVDPARLAKVIDAGLMNNRDVQNWMNYRGMIAAANYGDISPDMLSPEMKAKYKDAIERGATVPQIIMQEEYNDLRDRAHAYGVNKYRVNNYKSKIGSVDWGAGRDRQRLANEMFGQTGIGPGPAVLPFGFTDKDTFGSKEADITKRIAELQKITDANPNSPAAQKAKAELGQLKEQQLYINKTKAGTMVDMLIGQGSDNADRPKLLEAMENLVINNKVTPQQSELLKKYGTVQFDHPTEVERFTEYKQTPGGTVAVVHTQPKKTTLSELIQAEGLGKALGHLRTSSGKLIANKAPSPITTNNIYLGKPDPVLTQLVETAKGNLNVEGGEPIKKTEGVKSVHAIGVIPGSTESLLTVTLKNSENDEERTVTLRVPQNQSAIYESIRGIAKNYANRRDNNYRLGDIEAGGVEQQFLNVVTNSNQAFRNVLPGMTQQFTAGGLKGSGAMMASAPVLATFNDNMPLFGVTRGYGGQGRDGLLSFTNSVGQPMTWKDLGQYGERIAGQVGVNYDANGQVFAEDDATANLILSNYINNLATQTRRK